MDYTLIGILIGFAISYLTLMFILLMKVVLK